MRNQHAVCRNGHLGLVASGLPGFAELKSRRTLSELKQDAEIQGLVWFSHTVFNPI